MSLIDDFDWKTAKLNTLGAALVVAFAYLFIVIGFVSTKEVRQVFNFTLPGKLIPYYNLFLSIASLVMFSGTLIFTIERVSEEGWEWLLCEKCYEAKGPLWFFSYLYYLSKYYELLDTILLLFSGKMPANLFQNAYHHALILVLTWLWIETRASVQFIGILESTFVHAVTYFYRYRCSSRVIPWWKNCVAILQIFQFISLLVQAVGITAMLVYRWFSGIDGCNGVAVLYGQVLFKCTLLNGFWEILNGSKKRAKGKHDKKK